MNRRTAFTVIELLVVVSIIALLLAILLPGLAQARRQMRRVACQSNLRQIDLGWQSYLDCHDGAFLQGVNTNIIYGGWRGAYLDWPGRVLNPHVGAPLAVEQPGDAAVFECPADNGQVPGYGPGLSGFYCLGNSYQTNILLVGPDRLGTAHAELRPLHEAINQRLAGLRRDAVSEPARLVLLGDYGWVNQWNPESGFRTEWHGGEFQHNVGFLDGHVEFRRIDKGVYNGPDYRVLPFADLDRLAPKPGMS